MLENYMIELGYTSDDIKKILTTSPVDQYVEESLYNKIKIIIKYFASLGYDQKSIIELTVKNPVIFCYDLDSIKEKINNFLELGYTFLDIRIITLNYPRILGFSIDNINNKIKEIIDLGY